MMRSTALFLLLATLASAYDQAPATLRGSVEQEFEAGVAEAEEELPTYKRFLSSIDAYFHPESQHVRGRNLEVWQGIKPRGIGFSHDGGDGDKHTKDDRSDRSKDDKKGGKKDKDDKKGGKDDKKGGKKDSKDSKGGKKDSKDGGKDMKGSDK